MYCHRSFKDDIYHALSTRYQWNESKKMWDPVRIPTADKNASTNQNGPPFIDGGSNVSREARTIY